MQFVGKDFLSKSAPPGYRAGVGRGAVGFSTSGERGGSKDAFPSHSPARGKSVIHNVSKDRFADASAQSTKRIERENTDAEAIYAAIESKIASKRVKKKERTENEINANTPLKSSLKEVSIDEWASLPEASDLTHRNKRLRENERALKRNYAVPDSLILAQQDEEQRLAELRRKRLMLENLIRAEPHNPKGFLGLARLEQQAARHKRARIIIEKGSLMCPSSPEIWLESLLMHPNSSESRSIAAKACRSCPENEELWLRAVDLEPINVMKAQVTHEALLHCSNSSKLWLLAAQFEEDKVAKREILKTAAEFLPNKEDIWLALIDASDAGEQYTLLLEATKKNPGNLQIWLLTARKSEDTELEQVLQEIVAAIPRSELLTALFTLGFEDARIIKGLTRLLKLGPADLNDKLVKSETRSLIYSALPKSEALYIDWAKTDPRILEEAVSEFPNSSKLLCEYIAAGGNVDMVLKKCEAWNDVTLVQQAVESLLRRGQRDTAISILEIHATRDPVFLVRLIEIYELSNRRDEALRLLDRGIRQWPESAEIYIAKARLDHKNAKEHIKEGLKMVAISNKLRPVLWYELALSSGSSISRRAVLSKAIHEYPNDGAIWLQRVLLEKREGLPLTQVLDDALRNCPTYGLLWWEAIQAAPRSQRKSKLIEAVKSSRGDVYVLIAGGLLFVSAGQREKAKEWFLKAHHCEPTNGDVILWMSKYNLVDDELVNAAINGTACDGIIWAKVYQQSIICEHKVLSAFHSSVMELENPFDLT